MKHYKHGVFLFPLEKKFSSFHSIANVLFYLLNFNFSFIMTEIALFLIIMIIK